jgi:hypothetical protein
VTVAIRPGTAEAVPAALASAVGRGARLALHLTAVASDGETAFAGEAAMIHERPAQAGFWVPRPIGPRASIRLEYDWTTTDSLAPT